MTSGHRELAVCVGDRWKIALACELVEDPDKVVNEWYGSLWLWANGHVIGNTWVREEIGIGLQSLEQAAGTTRLKSKFLWSLSPDEALAFVMWANYGDDDPEQLRRIGDRQSVAVFEVLPLQAGPSFDNWQACLIEGDSEERFIWKGASEPSANEMFLPVGEFQRVVLAARNWVDRAGVRGGGL